MWRDAQQMGYVRSFPADILITNVAMLNVMLMRENEGKYISTNKGLVKEDKNNVFSFIVDELHSCRGTSGTEVALVIKNLLKRLELSPNSNQIRFLRQVLLLMVNRERIILNNFLV